MINGGPNCFHFVCQTDILADDELSLTHHARLQLPGRFQRDAEGGPAR